MGIVAGIILTATAFAQTPDWNRDMADSRSEGLPIFMEGAPEGIGVGFYFGRPLSLAGSYHKGAFTTQALLGMWLPDTYRLSLDQLYAVYTPSFGEYFSLPISVGLGGFAYFNEQKQGDIISGGGTNYNLYGIRAPINIALNHQEVALDFYVEVVPAIQVAQFNSGLSYNTYGGIGLRVYPFNKEE